MRIAMLGTRGVPARYGGFETAVEEIGRRLVGRGHEVTVYCRGAADRGQRRYAGMELVHVPALRRRSLETLSHTAVSVGHVIGTRRHDAAVVFNAANAPFLPALRLRGVPAAVHVDGLEWQRAKWGGAGRRYYRWAESLSVRWADALIADAQGIADYYHHEFGVESELLTYGAPVQVDPRTHRLPELGLTDRTFHLVVARFEPENHVAEIVAGYRRSASRLPLVVVGSAPYADAYTDRVRASAAGDPRIRLLGGIWDQELLDQLYAGCATYLHGHSVGGTNPSLLRAMGAGAPVIAFDVSFNREVVGPDGTFFRVPADVDHALLRAESAPEAMVERGRRLRTRAATRYQWSEVADGYEALLKRLTTGESVRGSATGRRRRAPR
jgi:glycosyltransferase involved in cell wall biosynthesis